MIWAVFLLVTALALAPFLLSLLRVARHRDRREAALALHRAQLEELDRDRAETRLGEAEHAAAVLEVQRRLLAVAHDPEPAQAATRFPLFLLLPLVPLVAVALYLLGGAPEMPAQPLAARQAEAARDEKLLSALRQRLAAMDPKSEPARQGFLLLGNAEAGRGHMAEAAVAWRVALDARFDPSLAAVTAEAISEAEGRVTEEAKDLFRRALATAPADAPWRPMAERRLRATP